MFRVIVNNIYIGLHCLVVYRLFHMVFVAENIFFISVFTLQATPIRKKERITHSQLKVSLRQDEAFTKIKVKKKYICAFKRARRVQNDGVTSQ